MDAKITLAKLHSCNWGDNYCRQKGVRHINTSAWDGVTSGEAALLTAFRSLQYLNITIDPTEADQLQALKKAQCEQALHELINDTDGQPISAMTLGGLLAVKMAPGNTPPGRYSKRAMQILGPYLSAPVVTRTR